MSQVVHLLIASLLGRTHTCSGWKSRTWPSGCCNLSKYNWFKSLGIPEINWIKRCWDQIFSAGNMLMQLLRHTHTHTLNIGYIFIHVDAHYYYIQQRSLLILRYSSSSLSLSVTTVLQRNPGVIALPTRPKPWIVKREIAQNSHRIVLFDSPISLSHFGPWNQSFFTVFCSYQICNPQKFFPVSHWRYSAP